MTAVREIVRANKEDSEAILGGTFILAPISVTGANINVQEIYRRMNIPELFERVKRSFTKDKTTIKGISRYTAQQKELEDL